MSRQWTEAQRQAARRRQSNYWMQMTKIADQLGVDKQLVHRCRSDLERTEAVKKLGEAAWVVFDSERALEILRASEESDGTPRDCGNDEDGDPNDATHEKIKMALWLIRKCGGVAEAEDALRRAKRALKE